MKKIIALLLALSCVFALAACKNDAPPAADPIDDFVAAVAVSDPTSASITNSVTSDLLGLTLNGTYDVTYNEDGSATVAYSYDQLAEIDENTTADELLYVVEGTATIAADGTVAGDVSGEVSAVAGVKLNLDKTKMTYSVSAGVLSATVKAADTEAVLGVAIATDVTMTVSIANGTVSAVTLAFETTVGAAEIVCVYNY